MKSLFLLFLIPAMVRAEPLRLVHDPALSPDGQTVAFCWMGDLWTVPTQGGRAIRLTSHPAMESNPAFSPNGKEIAFNSTRDGAKMAYVIPAAGGEVRQVSFHTDGCEIREWTPDGRSLLVNLLRDYSWQRESRSARLALMEVTQRAAEIPLFDDYALAGTLSRDGSQVLFMREGSEPWWRQGFKGSRAGQIWHFDRQKNAFRCLLSDEIENRSPLWRADQKGCYLVRQGNLWEYDFASKRTTQRTHFQEDLVTFPAISRDGRTLVFRVRFDLYRWHPGDAEPEKILIEGATEPDPDEVRVMLSKATEVHFAPSGLELAMVAGGDVWVMDAELKEPRRVTATEEEESSVQFAPDGKSLVFISESGGQPDVWSATRAEADAPWWENDRFILKRLTQDVQTETSPRFSPDGKKLAYLRERGDLWIADADGGNAKRLVESWNEPKFDFSPDGSWIVYSKEDEAFNDDIWLIPSDGSLPPHNLSQHPHDDSNPRWSPDGKRIAWTGRRDRDEVDIFYVNLSPNDDEQTARERTLAKARSKFTTSKKEEPTPQKGAAPKPASQPPPSKSAAPSTPPSDPKPNVETKSAKSEAPAAKPAPTAEKPVEHVKKTSRMPIDLNGIHDRIHRVTVAGTSEYALAWSPDSKKLAIHSSWNGRGSLRMLEWPDKLTSPTTLSTSSWTSVSWLKQGDQITGLVDGKPAMLAGKSGSSPRVLGFSAAQDYSRSSQQRALFEQCWRIMRDHYYDDRLGNRDWDAVRVKYSDMAAEAPDLDGVGECVLLMLGELNGSHLGFSWSAARNWRAAPWNEETGHLGLLYDAAFEGPGWKVKRVIPRSPASRQESQIRAGEVILKIDDKPVLRTTDVSSVLNGRMDRDIKVTVRGDGKTREVILRPISYTAARQLLYPAWIEENRAKVERISKGTLGYLHISAMDDASFQKFQEELYHAGAGKEGLIIDVRENGGGSTTDHLLTALTQPRHAIAIPRGSDLPGYPHDRMIYATWSKPIVVLCNQNSYSNAEVFSHAIQTLGRGALVGVPTAGGVISTGSTRVMDLGTLRLPFRGWYVLPTGQDMELNGARPEHLVWPEPGDDQDQQLEKAIEVLHREVEVWKIQPQPRRVKASER